MVIASILVILCGVCFAILCSLLFSFILFWLTRRKDLETKSYYVEDEDERLELPKHLAMHKYGFRGLKIQNDNNLSLFSIIVGSLSIPLVLSYGHQLFTAENLALFILIAMISIMLVYLICDLFAFAFANYYEVWKPQEYFTYQMRRIKCPETYRGKPVYTERRNGYTVVYIPYRPFIDLRKQMDCLQKAEAKAEAEAEAIANFEADLQNVVPDRAFDQVPNHQETRQSYIRVVK